MKNTHKDCKHYLALDVFKGNCKFDHKPLQADDAHCERFELLEKCRLCEHYRPVHEFTGLCMEQFDAYPDMSAKTCGDFTWKTSTN